MKMTLNYRCLSCGKLVQKTGEDANLEQMKVPAAPDDVSLSSGIWQQSWGLHRCSAQEIGALLFLGILLEG